MTSQDVREANEEIGGGNGNSSRHLRFELPNRELCLYGDYQHNFENKIVPH